jgi:hypothetical protein
MSDALKSCPFCGGEALPGPGVDVLCTGCEAFYPRTVDQWNQRRTLRDEEGLRKVVLGILEEGWDPRAVAPTPLVDAIMAAVKERLR